MKDGISQQGTIPWASSRQTADIPASNLVWFLLLVVWHFCWLFIVFKLESLPSNILGLLSPATNPQDASIKASFFFSEEWLNFLHLGVLDRKFSCLHFPPTSSHLHPLQVENWDSNSRLVTDEDDTGKYRSERVEYCTYSCHNSVNSFSQLAPKVRVTLGEVSDGTFLDELLRVHEVTRHVADQVFPLAWWQNLKTYLCRQNQGLNWSRKTWIVMII